MSDPWVRFATDGYKPASLVSGRSGANRRIGGKMAKVSRESRGGAVA